MAKKVIKTRGRTWVALILLGFVLMTASVIQRRVLGIGQAQEIRRLQDSLQAFQARKVKLLSEIDDAMDLSVIGPLAESRLGMRHPSETPSVILPKSQK